MSTGPLPPANGPAAKASAKSSAVAKYTTGTRGPKKRCDNVAAVANRLTPPTRTGSATRTPDAPPPPGTLTTVGSQPVTSAMMAGRPPDTHQMFILNPRAASHDDVPNWVVVAESPTIGSDATVLLCQYRPRENAPPKTDPALAVALPQSWLGTALSSSPSTVRVPRQITFVNATPYPPVFCRAFPTRPPTSVASPVIRTNPSTRRSSPTKRSRLPPRAPTLWAEPFTVTSTSKCERVIVPRLEPTHPTTPPISSTGLVEPAAVVSVMVPVITLLRSTELSSLSVKPPTRRIKPLGLVEVRSIATSMRDPLVKPVWLPSPAAPPTSEMLPARRLMVTAASTLTNRMWSRSRPTSPPTLLMATMGLLGSCSFVMVATTWESSTVFPRASPKSPPAAQLSLPPSTMVTEPLTFSEVYWSE